jgi:hypothetical protein
VIKRRTNGPLLHLFYFTKFKQNMIFRSPFTEPKSDLLHLFHILYATFLHFSLSQNVKYFIPPIWTFSIRSSAKTCWLASKLTKWWRKRWYLSQWVFIRKPISNYIYSNKWIGSISVFRNFSLFMSAQCFYKSCQLKKNKCHPLQRYNTEILCQGLVYMY